MCKKNADYLPLFTLFVFAVFCWPQLSVAQVSPATNPGDRNYALRTYEVGDLILNIQDHPYSESLESKPQSRGGGFGGGGGGFFSVPDNFGTSQSSTHCPSVAHPAVSHGATASFQLCQFGGGGMGMEMGNQPGGMGTAYAPVSRWITIDDLIRVLVSTVAADSWAQNGGRGEVQALGTALVVWQTPAVHTLVQDLLKQIRAGASDRKTVTIDARWLLLNSDELDKLLVEDQQAGVPQVKRDVLADYTRRPGSIRGMTSCFSGQLVYLVSGTRKNIVSSYIPVVGSIELPDRTDQLAALRDNSLFRLAADTSSTRQGNDRSVGYQPIIEKPNFGALLEVRATRMSNDETAVVDLKSTITVPGNQPQGSDVDSDVRGIAPPVDRISIETQEFATTLRMPLGNPVLVGGLTYSPVTASEPDSDRRESPAQAGRTAAEQPQLYLVLEVR